MVLKGIPRFRETRRILALFGMVRAQVFQALDVARADREPTRPFDRNVVGDQHTQNPADIAQVTQQWQQDHASLQAWRPHAAFQGHLEFPDRRHSKNLLQNLGDIFSCSGSEESRQRHAANFHAGQFAQMIASKPKSCNARGDAFENERVSKNVFKSAWVDIRSFGYPAGTHQRGPVSLGLANGRIAASTSRPVHRDDIVLLPCWVVSKKMFHPERSPAALRSAAALVAIEPNGARGVVSSN